MSEAGKQIITRCYNWINHLAEGVDLILNLEDGTQQSVPMFVAVSEAAVRQAEQTFEDYIRNFPNDHDGKMHIFRVRGTMRVGICSTKAAIKDYL